MRSHGGKTVSIRVFPYTDPGKRGFSRNRNPSRLPGGREQAVMAARHSVFLLLRVTLSFPTPMRGERTWFGDNHTTGSSQ